MGITGISSSPAAGIDKVLAQLRLAQARTQPTLTGAASAPTGAGAVGALAANAAGPLTGTQAALRGTLSLSADDSTTNVAGAGGGSFLTALKASLDQVNASQNQAAQLGAKFEKGEGNVDLNDVMVAMQKANVSFQAAVQVRNRMVSAYQTIMNMQI
jgi:flagellar hook-basal body complex protein FliE